MLIIGLAMLGGVVAMLAVAYPRGKQPVDWLRSETRQQAYGFTFVLLLTVGGLLVATSFGG